MMKRVLPWIAMLIGVAACASRSTSSSSTAKSTTEFTEYTEVEQAPSALVVTLQRLSDSVRLAQRWPGLSVAVVLADGRIAAAASGYADTVRKTLLTTSDRLLQGSVGKTYVSAVAMQLAAEGKLDLDAPIARYLGNEPWFDSLPNGR